jgi:exodeoxyribonuclease VII small subunit
VYRGAHRAACTDANAAQRENAMTTQPESLGQLEKSLEQLEALVERLEGGDLSLDEALQEFERGVKLTRQCQTALKAAEQKVEILLKKTEDAVPEPFEPASTADDA